MRALAGHPDKWPVGGEYPSLTGAVVTPESGQLQPLPFTNVEVETSSLNPLVIYYLLILFCILLS